MPTTRPLYQAEVTSIDTAMMHIDKMKPHMRVIKLFSDSQAALKALDSCVDNSKTIMECRRSLNEIPKHCKITRIWVPGQQDITALQTNWLGKEQPSKSFKKRTRLGCP